MNAPQLDEFVHGKRITFQESRSSTKEYAAHLDSQDKLAHFKAQFLTPSKANLKDPQPQIKPIDQQNGSYSPCSVPYC